MTTKGADRPRATPSPPSPRTIGEWKQEVLRLYNSVNQEITGAGVSRQRVQISDEHIVVVAEHHRVRTLATIASFDAVLGRWADAAILDAAKVRLAEVLTDLGVDVVSVLKDYDPVAELTATVIVLRAPLACSDDTTG